MKKILGIIGIGLVTGATCSFLLNKKRKKKNNINTHVDDFSSDRTVLITNPKDVEVENTEFEDVKGSVVENIYSRHKEASNIMKKSFDIICSRTEISEDDNRDLDEISDELDELLREDKR